MPAVALVALDNWLSSARMAGALRRAGLNVIGLCRRNSPLRLSHAIVRCVELADGVDTEGLASALDNLCRQDAVDAVIACDERALYRLHRVVALRQAGDALRELLIRSLGDPKGYPISTSKSATAAMASDLGILIPEQATCDTAADALAFARRIGYPVIIKTDQGYGGIGCYICRTAKDVRRHAALARLPRRLHRLRHVLPAGWLAGVASVLGWPRPRSRLIVQRFHEGPLAFVTAVAQAGRMLGAITVSAICVHPSPTGASSVVASLDRPELIDSTRRLIERLGFTGFVGADFIIDAQDDRAYLLELNPRLTPTCSVSHLLGIDLSAIYAHAIAAIPIPPALTDSPTPVAFFPNEWSRDPHSRFLRVAYHDVPVDEPRLMAEGIRRLPRWRRVLLALGLSAPPPMPGHARPHPPSRDSSRSAEASAPR